MKKDVRVVEDVRDRSSCSGMQNKDKLKLRKLDTQEHFRTRELWEEIFTEDTPEFLDYYYSVKTQNNEIYVIEDEGNIVSMLHLNPYEMRIKDKVYQTHYIVAVATKETYRRKGLMKQLLEHVLRVMTDRGEPFTFLMPAKEEIYLPFGFAFVYEQRQGKVKGEKSWDHTLEICMADEKDCDAIAQFANQRLDKYEIVTWRTESYYKTLLLELASEKGGILLAKKDGLIQGVFPYAYTNEQDEQLMIKEPLFYREEDFRQAIYHLTNSETEEVHCIGYGPETKPMIMARILNKDIVLQINKEEVYINEEV